MFHVASILDQWTEDHAAVIHFHHCKHCNTITQQNIREGKDGTNSRRTTFQQPPHELVVELLATARQQNGRNVTLMTINRRWWSPYRYPLHIGEPLPSDTPTLLSGMPGEHETERLEDGQAPASIPMQRYTPLSRDARSPFTSRRRSPLESVKEEIAETPPTESLATPPSPPGENGTEVPPEA